MPAVLCYPATWVSLLRGGVLVAGLLVAVWYGRDSLSWRLVAVGLLSLCALLDLLDGYLARRFQHVTPFGALLDQLIDLLMHTTLWLLSGVAWALPVLTLEWLAGLRVIYVSLFRQEYWKEALVQVNSSFAFHYFKQNQRNSLSALANVSHIIFPATLYLGVDFRWAAYLALPGVIIYEIATLFILVTLPRPPH